MKTDVAIIGGGPGGSCAAMHLARRGIDSVIVEKMPFPRFHIGEAMTGEAGGLCRELGLEDRMLAAGHPHRHGARVYGSGRKPWFVPVMQRLPNGELMEINTWQVRRSEFDSMLLNEAESRGATVIPGKAVRPLLNEDGSVGGVSVRPSEGGELELEAELVLDCSGQSTFMAKHGLTGPKYLGAYDKQIAIFSQVVGFQRDTGDDGRETLPGNTLIFYQSKYHWSWAIPLDDEVVSVGVVVPSQYFLDQKESKEDFLKRELRELSDELARRLPTVELVEDVHVIPNYSFQVSGFAGNGFICVGDAHRFIDPIFSFGLFAAMKEAGFAAETAARYLDERDPDLFREHMVHCDKGLDIVEDLIDAFWENPIAFSVLAHLKCREDMIDIFAGRIYPEDGQPSPTALRLRKLLQRERSYDHKDLYSVPVGSRYHPERDALWNSTLDSVETTERWMRETEVELAV